MRRGKIVAVLAWLAVLSVATAAAGATVRSSIYARATGDEPEYLLTALSLAEDRSLDISDEIDQERYRRFHEVPLRPQARVQAGGRMVSPHDPLLPLLLAPAMGLGGFLAAKMTIGLMAGTLAVLLAWLAVDRWHTRLLTAALTVGVFVAAAPLGIYSSQIYPEVPAALALTVAVAALTGPLRRGGLVALGTAVVALCWLGSKFIPVAATLALLGLVRLWRTERREAAAALIGAFAGLGALYVGGHFLWYGDWTAYATGEHFAQTGQFSVLGVSPDYYSRASRLIGLLVDGQFGLAAWQPAWLLVIPALAGLLVSRPPHWPVLAAPLLVGWLTATFLALTMHGFWSPGRQVVVVLPLVVLAVARWADGSRKALAVLAALGAVGVFNLGWLLWEGHTSGMTLAVHFEGTANPVYQTWSAVLPDYMAGDARSWILHGLWVVVALAVIAGQVVRSRRCTARSMGASSVRG